MPLGPGKYDPLLVSALNAAGATSGILIVLDGEHGPGFSAQGDPKTLLLLPKMLENMAAQIRLDNAKIVEG